MTCNDPLTNDWFKLDLGLDLCNVGLDDNDSPPNFPASTFLGLNEPSLTPIGSADEPEAQNGDPEKAEEAEPTKADAQQRNSDVVVNKEPNRKEKRAEKKVAAKVLKALEKPKTNAQNRKSDKADAAKAAAAKKANKVNQTVSNGSEAGNPKDKNPSLKRQAATKGKPAPDDSKQKSESPVSKKPKTTKPATGSGATDSAPKQPEVPLPAEPDEEALVEFEEDFDEFEMDYDQFFAEPDDGDETFEVDGTEGDLQGATYENIQKGALHRIWLITLPQYRAKGCWRNYVKHGKIMKGKFVSDVLSVIAKFTKTLPRRSQFDVLNELAGIMGDEKGKIAIQQAVANSFGDTVGSAGNFGETANEFQGMVVKKDERLLVDEEDDELKNYELNLAELEALFQENPNATIDEYLARVALSPHGHLILYKTSPNPIKSSYFWQRILRNSGIPVFVNSYGLNGNRPVLTSKRTMERQVVDAAF